MKSDLLPVNGGGCKHRGSWLKTWQLNSRIISNDLEQIGQGRCRRELQSPQREKMKRRIESLRMENECTSNFCCLFNLETELLRLPLYLCSRMLLSLQSVKWRMTQNEEMWWQSGTIIHVPLNSCPCSCLSCPKSSIVPLRATRSLSSSYLKCRIHWRKFTKR